jgi:hypothetical protein
VKKAAARGNGAGSPDLLQTISADGRKQKTKTQLKMWKVAAAETGAG